MGLPKLNFAVRLMKSVHPDATLLDTAHLLRGCHWHASYLQLCVTHENSLLQLNSGC